MLLYENICDPFFISAKIYGLQNHQNVTQEESTRLNKQDKNIRLGYLFIERNYTVLHICKYVNL